MTKFYAVRVGNKPGIYRSHEQFKEQCSGCSGADGRAFKNRVEALEYICSQRPEQGICVNEDWYCEATIKSKKKRRWLRMNDEQWHLLFFDGSTRWPTEVAGCGAFLSDPKGTVLWQGSFYFTAPFKTVAAEYQGLIAGMRAAEKIGVSRLIALGDNESVIMQMQGSANVKEKHDIKKHLEAKKLEKKFDEVCFQHVFRKYNRTAHNLAQKALRQHFNQNVFFIGLLFCISHLAATSTASC